MQKYLLTLITLLLATGLQATVKTVAPGDGTLKTAISSAASGDTLQLSTGTYGVSSNIDITTVGQHIILQAAAGSTPVVSISNGSIRLYASHTQLTVDGLTIEGTASSIRAIVVHSGIDSTSLTVHNCLFRHLQRAIYAQDARKTCQNVHITNSTFIHIGDADNRTIYFAAVSGEDDIQYDVTCEIDHCTFYDCNCKRMVYCPAYNGSHITNCIAMHTQVVDDANAYAVYGANSYVHNCLSYKAGIKTSSSATGANNIYQNPLFVDAANDNLQLYKNSPAVLAGTDGSTIGDPRWGVSEQEYDITLTPIAERMVKHPYSMSPTTSSIRILWQLSDSLSLGTVAYGTSPATLSDTVRSRGGWYVWGEGYVHVVELTGLQPFTRYYVQVGDQRQMYDVISSTKTAPEEGTAYRIFTISDIHVNSCKNWEKMQDSICTLGADLMMCNGDFVNNGAGRDWNAALFTPGRPMLSMTPIMSSAGNHETGDPLTYRWSTFFDYFSQFSHGASEDSIRDPRGEGYFAYDYGNARILAVNVSDEPSSPLFSKTSDQFKWLENELSTCTKSWILIFGHVGLTTSGYHGQWPPQYRNDWRALLERYAALGKHIIYFCGDDHSFEHAYKSGVHYVRPACGRNANYAQITTLRDAKYSLFFRQISCYSTLDVAADGSSIELIARDSASNEFYRYTFTQTPLMLPSLTYSTPTAKYIQGGHIRIRHQNQVFTAVGQRL